MRVARPVNLNPEERQQLEQQARARSLPARQVERARIVLLAAEGWQGKQISDEWGSVKIGGGVARALPASRLSGLAKDAPRLGRPRTITAAKADEFIVKTTLEKPAAASHWS